MTSLSKYDNKPLDREVPEQHNWLVAKTKEIIGMEIKQFLKITGVSAGTISKLHQVLSGSEVQILPPKEIEGFHVLHEVMKQEEGLTPKQCAFLREAKYDSQYDTYTIHLEIISYFHCHYVCIDNQSRQVFFHPGIEVMRAIYKALEIHPEKDRVSF